MRIMITGSKGMVGSNIVEHSKCKYHTLLTPPREELNLLDYESIEKYLVDKRPDLLIHCAGTVGGIQANINDPVKFLIENLDMGKNIVLAARKMGIRKIINLGSSCMYPRNAENPLKEEMILKGELEPTNEGYALAKITVASLCKYITIENPLYKYKTIIPCNLYGRWDNFDIQNSHMIPAVIKKIHDAKINSYKEVEIWGNGEARREFMYCGDLAEFVWFAIDHFEDLPLIMNTGLGYDYTINDYYKSIAKVIGFNGNFKHNLTKPVGMKRKMVDVSMQSSIGWSPQTDLDSGLYKTYEFYKKKFLP